LIAGIFSKNLFFMKPIQAFKIAEANERLKLFDHDLFLPFLCCVVMGEISFYV